MVGRPRFTNTIGDTPLVDVDLEEVSNLYAEGGEELVREALGLDGVPEEKVSSLIARALDAHPIDFDRVKVVEGVHPGLVARAHRQNLTSSESATRARAVELHYREQGLLKDDADPGTRAIEAVREILAIVMGEKPVPQIGSGEPALMIEAGDASDP